MAQIDTLKVYKKYLEAGYTEDQAVTAVQALNSSFDTVATKNDILNLEKDLYKEIKTLEKSIDSKFNTIKSKFNIIEKIGGSFCISIIILLIKIAFWP